MKKLLLLTILIACSLAGCSKPQVKSVSMHWGAVNSSVTQIVSDVTVSDPLPFPIPLSGVNVKIYMNGIEMGTGHSIGKTEITPPQSKIELLINLLNRKLPEWWVTHIKNGEKTKVEIVSNIVFSILGFKFEVPVTKVSQFTTDFLSGVKLKNSEIIYNGLKLGEVRDIKLRWGNVNLNKTQVVVEAKVVNECNVPIVLRSISYDVFMNDVKMGSGKVQKVVTVPPKSVKNIEFSMYIKNSKIPDWWVTHIKNGEKTKVKINMGLDIYAVREIFLPLNYTYTVRTNILESPVG